MTFSDDVLKGIETIGIVDQDSIRLAPVAAVLLRRMLIESPKESLRSIQVFHAGYESKGDKVSDRARSYLQRQGFKITDHVYIETINRNWIYEKNIIFVMDKFLKRDIIYHYKMRGKDLEKHVFTLIEAAGMKDRIRDPGEDYSFEIDPVFELIKQCLQEIVKKISRLN